MTHQIPAIGSIVKFKKGIHDFECYAEPGMKARVIGITGLYTTDPDPQDHVYKLSVDFAEFDEYNKQFETYNYYDRDGIPRLNAREAGLYRIQDDIYMSNPDCDPWLKYLSVLAD
jgi:hypothetical protein